MGKPTSLSPLEVVRMLQSLRVNISVKQDFHGQVAQIDSLLRNDMTGIVTPVMDFMTHCATVPMKIETKNESLNNILSDWQKKFLNKGINIDIPVGLRELSAQYFRERFRSSMIALKVKWGTIDAGANGKFIIPEKMWFLNGSAIEVKNNNALNKKTYSVFNSDNEKTPLVNTLNESIFIRKPFSSWYENYPVPYLVRRGTLFNALIKNAISQKQSDLIESIVPYLFQIKAGTDVIAQHVENLLPDEEDMKKLKNELLNSKEKWNETRDLKELIATLRYDVKLEHLIPDLTKFLNEDIVRSADKNLLSSLGLIELQGFSSNRQEAILNPKVLIEEIQDAVLDWASLLENVLFEMMERNAPQHRNLANNDLTVSPGIIKAFLTNEMKTMIRNLYDRGLFSKETTAESIGEILDFEVEVNKRKKEDSDGLQETMTPPLTQFIQQKEEAPDLENQDKKPGTPEVENFKNAELEEQVISYETIDELPKEVKEILPVGAQMIWLKNYNQVADKTNNKEEAENSAWNKVAQKYEKQPKKKIWRKRS